ncbi:uncharacterized protein [Coffea arabica]|uniref:DUF4408 domain-containing protein n=1 Tax=Coffea arabica TaxID=13443 RepID=A0A6P6WCB0_COFAR|nr:uncharacterized protein LOC113730909 [Coffea arabica]
MQPGRKSSPDSKLSIYTPLSGLLEITNRRKKIMSFPTTLLLSLKIILISTGAISMAMGMIFSVPSITAFTCYDLPVVWKSVVTWLKPPYLYFIINVIIITIAASSRFSHHHQSKNSDSYQSREPLISVRTPPPSDVVAAVVLAQREDELNRNAVEAPGPLSLPPPPVVEVYVAEAEAEDEEEDEDEKVVELKPVVVNGVQFEAVGGTEDADDVANDEWVVSESSATPSQKMVSPESPLDLLLPEKEKPLTASRFGHRKPIKTSPEGGRALRVARPKRDETLESTWKMITDGRHVPLTRHLKRSDTWENHGREVLVNPSLDSEHDFTPDHVPKSQTFRDRTNYYDAQTTGPPASLSPVPGRISREPSPGQDELNRRVEAFIKKFNEDMRLQRQESLNQYMEMINRGAN